MFQPVVPFGGYAGWRFLERTLEIQQAAHTASPIRQRDTDYFRAEIGKVRSPADLVADRRLLAVALGAFGLDDDINNKAFIERILSDGTIQPDALSNRLADKRYRAFSKAFGFGVPGLFPRTGLSSFPDEILSAYNVRQFEIDVGAQNENLRLALTARREIADIVTGSSSDRAQWFTVMGNPPLRRVFEGALGLPSQIATVDLDQQLGIFQDRAQRIFGTDKVSDFTDPELVDDLIRRFLVRAELDASPTGLASGQTALILLGGA